MINWGGTGIFWITMANVFACLFLATLIGRPWAAAFPYKLKAPALFYLSPVFGLATLTLAASFIGRFLPLGNTIVVPWLIIAMLLWALLREKHVSRAFYQALMVSVFGILCGLSLLVPLFIYGAYNAHNDTFTYLIHSNWLQQHSFNEVITAETVTAPTTHVALYLTLGFRMGASYLLALLQALFNLRWPYEVYPAVIISAVTACCLALGFPLQRALRTIHRRMRLILLVLPSFSLGGITFGANLGFLPQTVGLAFGAALLFVNGLLFRWMVRAKPSNLAILKAALPSALLFAAMTFAYSEVMPFLVLGISVSGFVMACRFRTWKSILLYGTVLIGCSILLLNTELLRTYAALRAQSGAVVGGPVEWTIIGHMAHAFGVHGGAWDLFQWSRPEYVGTLHFVFGLFLLVLLLVVVLASLRRLRQVIVDGSFLPVVVTLIVFGLTILYFRYFVQSPFPTGVGQSWSQFKLSDWSHPFVMVILLFAFASLRPRLGKLFSASVLVLFIVGLINTGFYSLMRIRPLMSYYTGVNDLNQFYLDVRDRVNAKCPPAAPIYLALQGQHQKFRQMVSLYLDDRELLSNWMDDPSIFPTLPIEKRIKEVIQNSCVIEPSNENNLLSNNTTTVGPFRIGVFDGQGRIQISSVTGAHNRESDSNNWWYWVEHKVNFKLQARLIPLKAGQTKLHFEYATRGPQTLSVHLITQTGVNRRIVLATKGDEHMVFDQTINIAPNELAAISIETDGKAEVLGKNDPRMAAWLIRNMSLRPVLG